MYLVPVLLSAWDTPVKTEAGHRHRSFARSSADIEVSGRSRMNPQGVGSGAMGVSEAGKRCLNLFVFPRVKI